jgi:hypothetical protein
MERGDAAVEELPKSRRAMRIVKRVRKTMVGQAAGGKDGS